jgi:hypothetical protein
VLTSTRKCTIRTILSSQNSIHPESSRKGIPLISTPGLSSQVSRRSRTFISYCPTCSQSQSPKPARMTLLRRKQNISMLGLGVSREISGWTELRAWKIRYATYWGLSRTMDVSHTLALKCMKHSGKDHTNSFGSVRWGCWVLPWCSSSS